MSEFTSEKGKRKYNKKKVDPISLFGRTDFVPHSLTSSAMHPTLLKKDDCDEMSEMGVYECICNATHIAQKDDCYE